MDTAVLINARLAGVEPIFLRRFEIGVTGGGAVLAPLPLGHLPVFYGFAVDRPRLAMVVRRGHARAVVAMGEHLEPELRVLVENFHPAGRVVAAILPHEILVREQSLEPGAHLLAAGGAGIARESSAAVGDELVEVVGHLCLPRRSTLG